MQSGRPGCPAKYRSFISGWIAALICLFPGTAFAAPESIHVLVMVVDFSNAPAPDNLRYWDSGVQTVPINIANAEAVFFTGPTSTAARYADMSQGEMTITGDVVEVSLALNLATSESHVWRAAADAAAVVQGHTLTDYDRFGYLLPYGFSGQTSAGAAAEDWFWAAGLLDYISEYTFNHELGHALALEHASEIQANGTVTTYGDLTDFMGSGNAVHTNAVNKHRKGWLTGSRHQSHVLDSASSYLLSPLADPLDSLQVVSIDTHGAHSDLGVPVDTYLSFRVPTGFDQNLSTSNDSYSTPLNNTVHVHHGRKDGTFSTYLDRALEVGDIYSIQQTTIEVLSISAAGANVSVGQTPYFPVAPSVSVSPVASNQGFHGSTLEYTLSITNNDTGVAFPAFYEDSYTTPGPGWIVSWDSVPKHILVDPGATEVIGVLRVISPFGVAPGIYNIDMHLTNHTGSDGPVSSLASLSYEVLIPADVTPPPPPTALFGNTFPGSGDDYAVLQWTAPPDASDVSVYRQYRNGVALPTLTGITIAVDFSFSALVTNAYVVRSVDFAGLESEPSNSIVLGALDLDPPSVPTNLLGSAVDGDVILTWGAAVDNTWVEKYEIHRNGILYDSTSSLAFTDENPLPGVSVYTVFAVDASGNSSPASPPWLLGGVALPALNLPALVLLGLSLLFSAGHLLSTKFRVRDFR